MSKPRSKKPASATAHDTGLNPQAAALALRALRIVDENPYVLAALIDWIRIEWKGEVRLSAIDDFTAAVEWIEKRGRQLLLEAIKYGADSAIRGAVNS